MKTADLNHILATAECIISKSVPIIGEAHRRGGYLCVASDEGTILAIVRYGEITSNEKAQRYMSRCQEKAVRLASHPEHVSSWQSRDDAADQKGGAVRVGRFIYSFSGLPELWDEACMIALGKSVPLTSIDESHWDTVVSSNNNPYASLQ